MGGSQAEFSFFITLKCNIEYLAGTRSQGVAQCLNFRLLRLVGGQRHTEVHAITLIARFNLQRITHLHHLGYGPAYLEGE